MVMYEDDAVGNLFLRYETIPSAAEVVRDVLNAPIESGETFQNKKKGRKAIKDKAIVIDAALGKKALDEVVKTVEEKTGWVPMTITEGPKGYKGLHGFQLPEDAESEQKRLMGM